LFCLNGRGGLNKKGYGISIYLPISNISRSKNNVFQTKL